MKSSEFMEFSSFYNINPYQILNFQISNVSLGLKCKIIQEKNVRNSSIVFSDMDTAAANNLNLHRRISNYLD